MCIKKTFMPKFKALRYFYWKAAGGMVHTSSFSNNLGPRSVIRIAPTGAVMRIDIIAMIRTVLAYVS